MVIDISSNGSLADEAALLTGFAAVIGAATGTIVALLRRDVRKNNSKIQEVADTLNRVDEEIQPGETPSVGQRLVRIEKQVDTISDSLLDLSGAMTQHIIWEEKKTARIDKRLTDVEDTLYAVRDCIEKNQPEQPATSLKRVRKKSGS